jgi:hypothetical protein
MRWRITRKIWHFVSEPRNLAVLVALGTGVGFLWTGRVGLGIQVEKAREPKIFEHATANGGVAVNAAGQAQVTVGLETSSDFGVAK